VALIVRLGQNDRVEVINNDMKELDTCKPDVLEGRKQLICKGSVGIMFIGL